MRKTKYVRTKDGLFIIFNDGLGIDHHTAALMITDGDISKVSDAGFAHLEEGNLRVFGKSYSLSIGSNSHAVKTINDTANAGLMRGYKWKDCDWIASNAIIESLYDFDVYEKVSDLVALRILVEE